MKIYFAGSIRGGRKDTKLYCDIISYLKPFGKVVTEHVGSKKISNKGEVDKKDNFLYNRDMKWLNSSDVIIAEVSTPSLGTGFEIGRATNLKIPILCLYNSKKKKLLSAMISGCPKITLKKYKNLKDIKIIISDFLK